MAILEAVTEWERPMAVKDELAALVTRYQHRLYRYLLRLVREPAAAEDLFQQTWLRVLQSIRRYDAHRSFEAWLFAVAHNLAIDHLRRGRLESLDEPPSEPVAADPDALERCLASERTGLLAASMSQLPALYREVLTLRFEEEMKLEEIAEVVRVPLSTVKSRLRRALESLRARLEKRV
jgi:RNA polymerase sigma-70 factor (ECF subfamily)